jgi:hypothetical protein
MSVAYKEALAELRRRFQDGEIGDEAFERSKVGAPGKLAQWCRRVVRPFGTRGLGKCHSSECGGCHWPQFSRHAGFSRYVFVRLVCLAALTHVELPHPREQLALKKQDAELKEKNEPAPADGRKKTADADDQDEVCFSWQA